MEQDKRLAIVDDHALFRSGLRALLEREPGLKVVGEASDARTAVELARQAPLDGAIVDVTLPGTSGIALARELLRLQPRCKVLALSMVEQPSHVAEMVRAGAIGYALKSQGPEEIVAALRLVLGNVRYLAPRLSRQQIEALLSATTGPLGELSRREREVFDLLVRGHTNDAVAAELFISRRTVETHRQRIMHKLDVHSIVELIRFAANHGYLAD